MRHRKNYHLALKWSLAALILILALPFVLGGANYINEHYAAQEITAYELNNETNVLATPWIGTFKTKFSYFDNPSPANLAPFWNDSGMNEVVIPKYTFNNSYTEKLFIGWNLTPSRILNNNINTVRINIQGLNNNGTVRIALFYDTDTSATLLSMTYTNITNQTLLKDIQIDPAKTSYAKSTVGDIPLMISITATNTTYKPLISGSVIKFSIIALKPHGGIVINGESFVNAVAELYGVIFIVAAVFATGAVNPTHKHMFDGLYYGLKKYSKMRRKQKYRKLRNKYYSAGRRYRW